MHDAAACIAHAEQLDAEFGGILLQLAHLFGGGVHLDRHIAEYLFGRGRRGMVHGRQRALGTAHRQFQGFSTLNACGEVTS